MVVKREQHQWSRRKENKLKIQSKCISFGNVTYLVNSKKMPNMKGESQHYRTLHGTNKPVHEEQMAWQSMIRITIEATNDPSHRIRRQHHLETTTSLGFVREIGPRNRGGSTVK